MLNDIVSVLIVYKVLGALNNLIQHHVDLAVFAILQNSLNHPTSVGVGGQRHNVAEKVVNNKLNRRPGRLLNALLDNMVAVLVTHALHDMTFKLLQERGLKLPLNHFDCLLHHPAPVHVERERKHPPPHGRGEGGPLVVCPPLHKLLDHVVSKEVSHQRECVWEERLKHLLLLGRRRDLELCLDEPRAVLVPAELVALSDNVAQLKLSHLASPKLLQQSRTLHVGTRSV
mmetsp:Transcript_40643/g.94308  ORF Transcript_40643/g.94308 Transcript_40643/m.94308 type:complete len:229 (+) Transcript_40643:1055-1741(+)